MAGREPLTNAQREAYEGEWERNFNNDLGWGFEDARSWHHALPPAHLGQPSAPFTRFVPNSVSPSSFAHSSSPAPPSFPHQVFNTAVRSNTLPPPTRHFLARSQAQARLRAYHHSPPPAPANTHTHNPLPHSAPQRSALPRPQRLPAPFAHGEVLRGLAQPAAPHGHQWRAPAAAVHARDDLAEGDLYASEEHSISSHSSAFGGRGPPESVYDTRTNSEEDEDEDEMPVAPARRSARLGGHSPAVEEAAGAGGGVVDLTNQPTSPPTAMSGGRGSDRSRGVKRRAEANSSAHASSSADTNSHAHKRPRASLPIHHHREESPIESVDLTGSQALLASEHHKAILTQQQDTAAAAVDDQPQRIGRRTCIICMEPYTAAAVTPCGHIYCHECLVLALKTGERNSGTAVGNCPVCRKGVRRKVAKGGIVEVKFLTRKGFERGMGRRGLPGG
ncbi:hypothetical protein LTR53_010089 [Teratosphaeriaceae sp. CCFEE 6253]|nr:hypothetical protein LTR53_010089 [Teratosphaeriaceae sp. CCFEE 6253]